MPNSCRGYSSLEWKLTIRQNDTLKKVQFALAGYPDIGSPNWTGKIYIKENFESINAFVIKDLGKNFYNTRFTMDLGHSETSILPLGTLGLFVVVENLVDYPLPIRRHIMLGELVVQASAIAGILRDPGAENVGISPYTVGVIEGNTGTSVRHEEERKEITWVNGLPTLIKIWADTNKTLLLWTTSIEYVEGKINAVRKINEISGVTKTKTITWTEGMPTAVTTV